MKNGISNGVNVTIPAAPFAIKGGDGLLIGKLFGVAAGTALLNEPVVIVTQGVFRMAKTPAGALAIGAPVYFHPGVAPAPGEVSDVATGGTRIGVAVAAALDPSDTADVRLDGIVA